MSDTLSIQHNRSGAPQTHTINKPVIRLLTRMYRATPTGQQGGFIVSVDRASRRSVVVVEGREFDEHHDFVDPFGHDRTGFGSLVDAVEYAARRGWTSSALTLWVVDYRVQVAA
ncbi:hypothetical protein [uncultured Jatrophihabitans sp.]|uniref:hypothetical protein n=1 Tax=uncultured Jatrophihabitans sp. TaxID=1610747 RepID=UPI0035CC3CDE